MLEQCRSFHLRGRLILVVEDDYLIADDVCRTLEDQGASVLGPAPSVADAMVLLARGDQPDTALLDVKLGDEVVYPLADILRDQGIPFVFVTAYRQKDLPEAYAQSPRCEKPLDMRQLMRVLAR